MKEEKEEKEKEEKEEKEKVDELLRRCWFTPGTKQIDRMVKEMVV